MKLSRVFLLVVLSLVVFLSQSDAASIYGTVTHESQPVDQAKVVAFTFSFTSRDSVVVETETDTTGNYRFDNLEAGQYVVTAFHHEYKTATNPNVTLNSADSEVEVNLELGRGGGPILSSQITGTVMNCKTFEPVPNTDVYLRLVPEDNAILADTTFHSVTDEFGAFIFEELTPGEYALSAAVEEYQDFVKLQNIIIEQHEIFFQKEYNIYLAPIGDEVFATIFGTANLKQNEWDLSNKAQISFVPVSNTDDSMYVYKTQTNKDGTYSLENAVPGEYNAICQPEFIPSVIEKEVTLPADTIQIDFSYEDVPQEDPGTIEGQVTNEADGSPIENAYVEVISTSNGWGTHPPNYTSVVTDENGNYSAEVPAGEYYVACWLSTADSNLWHGQHLFYDNAHSIFDATPVTVVKDEITANIDFVFAKIDSVTNVKISGKVTDAAGNPLQDATVSAWSLRTLFNDGTIVKTDADGNYLLEFTIESYNFYNMQPFVLVSAEKEDYQIEFYNEKTEFYLADPVFIAAGSEIQDINFTLDEMDSTSAFSISGTIVSEEDGTPISGAFVIGSSGRAGKIAFAFSDSAGNYSLSNLDASDYYVLFAADGYVPEFYDGVTTWEDATTIPVDGAVTGINADLIKILADSSGGGLAGLIIDENGDPVSGALITLTDSDDNTTGFNFTDGNGEYSITGLKDGTYRVSASKVDYSSTSEEFTYDGTESNTRMVNMTVQSCTASAVEEEQRSVAAQPTQFELRNNYPNPFNPATTISYSLPEAQQVRLVIYNLLGSEVQELVNGYKPAGKYSVTWNGKDSQGTKVASGLYIFSLEAKDTKIMRKMLLSK